MLGEEDGDALGGGEAAGELEDDAFPAFYRSVVESLLEGREDAVLATQLDRFAEEALSVEKRAQNLAVGRRVEAPGVCVLRLDAQLDGRMIDIANIRMAQSILRKADAISAAAR